MWVPPEEKDPVLLHAPTRKSMALFGAANLRSGKLVTMLASPFNAQSFGAFLDELARHRDRRRRNVVILDNAGYHRLEGCPATLTLDTCRRTVPSSIPLSGYGNSCAGSACIISTLRRLIVSSAR